MADMHISGRIDVGTPSFDDVLPGAVVQQKPGEGPGPSGMAKVMSGTTGAPVQVGKTLGRNAGEAAAKTTNVATLPTLKNAEAEPAKAVLGGAGHKVEQAKVTGDNAFMAGLKAIGRAIEKFFFTIGLDKQEKAVFNVLDQSDKSAEAVINDLGKPLDTLSLRTLLSGENLKKVQSGLGKARTFELMGALIQQSYKEGNTEFANSFTAPELRRARLDAAVATSDATVPLEHFLQTNRSPEMHDVLMRATTFCKTEIKFCERFAEFMEKYKSVQSDVDKKNLIQEFMQQLKEDRISLEAPEGAGSFDEIDDTGYLNTSKNILDKFHTACTDKPDEAVDLLKSIFKGISHDIKDNITRNHDLNLAKD